MRALPIRVLLCLCAIAAAVWPLESHAAVKAIPVRSDLDGDHQSDTAISRISGSTLKIKIHLSRLQSPVRLSTVVEYEPGLELSAFDVNNDHRVDLVLTSIFSVRPVAVWLNRSNGRFKKATGWIAAFPIHDSGPQFRRRTLTLSAQDALDWTDHLPVLSYSSRPGATLQNYGRAAPDVVSASLTPCYTNCSERAPPRLSILL